MMITQVQVIPRRISRCKPSSLGKTSKLVFLSFVALSHSFGVRFASQTYQRKIPIQRDWYFSLVNHVDITWNSFLPYLINLTHRLEALGFRYVDSKVIIAKEETDAK